VNPWVTYYFGAYHQCSIKIKIINFSRSSMSANANKKNIINFFCAHQ
jgi:hypothetical protein